MLMATLFCVIAGGFLSGRVFSTHPARSLDALVDTLSGVVLGLVIGGITSAVAAFKMNPAWLGKANLAALAALVLGFLFLFLAQQFNLWQ